MCFYFTDFQVILGFILVLIKNLKTSLKHLIYLYVGL